ncbi:unnamed protein product, partial [Heterosigma akashiwo]
LSSGTPRGSPRVPLGSGLGQPAVQLLGLSLQAVQICLREVSAPAP